MIRKQKVQAKYSLKQKKNLEKILLERLSSLGTIEGILLKIEGAASDNEVRVKKFTYLFIYLFILIHLMITVPNERIHIYNQRLLIYIALEQVP